MKKILFTLATSSMLLLSGCVSSGEQGVNVNKDYKAELKARNQELEQRNLDINARNKEIEALKKRLDASQQVATASVNTHPQQASSTVTSLSDSLLPPNAKTGQCFARVYTPPTYRTDTETVLKAEGYDEVEIIPAVYGTESKTVMTQEATEVLDVIPAVYGWKEEQVLVSPEITELQRVPAQYGFEEEKLLIKPAHTIWKKGTGPITKISESTGEIMCLVEVPAAYKTVKKRVLISAETTRPVVVKEAIYKTVKTRVVKEPAKTVSRSIPAVYDTVSVKKLVTEASTSSVNVPAKYETVNTTVKVTDGYLKWAPILCETNVTGDIVKALQQSLNTKGYKSGPVDGVYGWKTTDAVRRYQSDNSLTGDGQLTIEVVDALDINY